MNTQTASVARRCLEGAENNTMTFPQIISALMEAGFEGYEVDLRRGRATYYLLDGSTLDLATHEIEGSVSAAFDENALQSAIREAQALAPGYTYKGFCSKAMRAGCAGYIVSFSGRRAVYFGRTAETHVEHFPQ